MAAATDSTYLTSSEVDQKWAKLREIFSKYDADESGDLDVQEMALVLKVAFDTIGLLVQP